MSRASRPAGCTSPFGRELWTGRPPNDHLALARSGVWVVDAKTHRGELEVRRSGGLRSPRVEKLFVGGRDRTSLVDGVVAQMQAVRAALGDDPVPIFGALCFVGTELPWFASSSLGGIPLVGRRGLAKLVTADGSCTADDRERLDGRLAGAFPAARG